MSETLQTSFSNTEAKGRITLFRNYFDGGNGYYGRFNRNTVTMRTLIARIQARKAGTNELNVQEIAGFLKEEILAALRNGEAVNIMDLGTLFIATRGTYDGSSFVAAGGRPPLQVKFTPSGLTQGTVDNIRIEDVRLSDTAMRIQSVLDRYTGEENCIMTVGKEVSLKGELLKVGGTDSGVFLSPVDGNGNASQDRSTWLRCERLTRNGNGELSFYVPDSAVPEAGYRILVRSQFSRSKTGKSLSFVRTAESCVLTARNA